VQIITHPAEKTRRGDPEGYRQPGIAVACSSVELCLFLSLGICQSSNPLPCPSLPGLASPDHTPDQSVAARSNKSGRCTPLYLPLCLCLARRRGLCKIPMIPAGTNTRTSSSVPLARKTRLCVCVQRERERKRDWRARIRMHTYA